MHQDGFYPANDIELRPSTPVRSIHPTSRQLQLATGERIGYRRLLLATGAAPRRLPLPAMDLDGVHYLRTRQDADTLATAAAHAEHVVVVGTGWIGSEAAASLRQLGREVTLIGPDTAPLARVLGPEIGRVYRDLHADHGVRLALGTRVAGLRGHGRVEAVLTSDGRTFDCDLVLVGAGAVPRTELAEAAGLPVRDGVLVNEQLEAVGAAGVYAAGDVAAAWHPRYQAYLRVEHWANALNQGPAAARNMLGIPTAYARLPYFYSDQYDLGMEYSGFAADWDRVVVRGDLAAREFIAFWLKDQRVVAAMNAGVWDVVEPIQQLIRGGRPVDPARLANPNLPLRPAARSPAVGGKDGLDPGHVPVGAEVADVVEELVQLERGAAPLVAWVGRPVVQIGVPQLGRQAVRQLHVGQLQLPVGEGDRRVDHPAALDHVAHPQVPVGQRRRRARPQQRRQRTLAGPLDTPAQRLGDPRVAEMGPDPVRDVEARPVVGPAVGLDGDALEVVAVPAEPVPGGAVQPGDGPPKTRPVRRAADTFQDQRLAGDPEHGRHRDAGGGQRLEAVGLDLGRVRAALDHHLPPVGQPAPDGAADETALQRLGGDERGQAGRPLTP